MKKFFFIAVAAMAMAACAKTEVKTPDTLIAFKPFSQVNTKVTGTVFPTTETFGTYAWTAGTTGAFFIENKEVSFANGVWTTATPYYWPKGQSVDFFSYYPFNPAGNVPQVQDNKLTYSDIDFSTTQVDLMYADKAVAYTDNADQVEDGQNAYEGVPTIFRHAASKVKVNVILGENEKTEADGTVTKWEVTLKSVILSGIYYKGDCVLNLATSPASGLVSWTKPQDAAGNYVWTANTSLTNDVNNSLYTDVQVRHLVKNEGVTVIGASLGANQYDGIYMLPQTLVAGQQKINFVFDVVTYRKAPGATDFVQALTQNDVALSANLLIDTGTPATSVFAWQMNQSIVYNITIGPAGKQITFDPAIDNWENKTYATNIELEI